MWVMLNSKADKPVTLISRYPEMQVNEMHVLYDRLHIVSFPKKSPQ